MIVSIVAVSQAGQVAAQAPSRIESDLVYRPFAIGDRAAVADLLDEAFRTAPDAPVWMDGGRVLVDRETIVATALLKRVGQFFGGRPVPVAAVSGVTVAPTQRQRGYGRHIVEALCAELAGTGAAMAFGYPSAPKLYRRCGWECSAYRFLYSCPPVELRMSGYKDASGINVEHWDCRRLGEIMDCYRRAAHDSNGLVDRPESWWREHIVRPSDQNLRGYLVKGPNGIEAYALYQQEALTGSTHFFEAHCRELIWTTPTALAALLGVLAAQGWHARRFHWPGPVDEPLQAEFGHLGVDVELRLPQMARITSLSTAISSRGYPPHLDVELALQVGDPLLAANDGAFHLKVSSGRGLIERMAARKRPSCELDIGAFAAIFTGWLHPHDAHRLRRLKCSTEALGLLASMFSGPTPWTPEYF